MAKTNFGEWAKDINWIKVSFVVIIAILLVYVWNKLFGSNGIIAGSWGYLQGVADWTGDALQKSVEDQKQMFKQGWHQLEKGAENYYKDVETIIEEGGSVLKEWLNF